MPNFLASRQPFMIDGHTRQRVTMATFTIERKKKSPARGAIAPLVLIDPVTRAVAPDLEHTVGGHIIGLKLGGPDTSENLVPMYAGFNGTTYKRIETEIYDDPTISDMKVIVSYRCLPPNMPSQFTVYVKRGGGPFQLYAALPMMEEPAPIRYAFHDRDEVSRIIRLAQRKILEDEWIAFKASQSVFEKINAGPYEFLDYLYVKKRSDYFELCYHLGVETTQFSIGKGMDFDDAQIDMIKKINWFFSGDFVRSDHDRTVLLEGSSTLSPHIDHMRAKTTALGPNLFSNARVTSAIQNMSKGTKRIGDHLPESETVASPASSLSLVGTSSSASNTMDADSRKKSKYG